MEKYVYYSIGVFSSFIFLLYIYLLYEKLLEISKLKRERVYEKEILSYLDKVLIEIDETYPGEAEIERLRDMVGSKIKGQIIMKRILYYLDLFIGSTQRNIVRLSEEIGLVECEIKELKSRDYYRRALAAKNLGELRIKKALPELLRSLDSKFPDVQYHALMAISKIGDIEAFTEGINSIGSRELTLSERSLTEIVDSFEGDKRALYRKMIDSRNVYLSTLFIKSSGNNMDLALSEEIGKYIDDEDGDRRIAAIKAVGQIGDTRFAEKVAGKIKDKEWEVRSAAARSLGLIGGREGLDYLIDALSDSAWWVRFNAARAILQIPGGVGRLDKVLQGEDKFAKDALISAMEDTGVISDIYLYEYSAEKEKRHLFSELQKYMSGPGEE